MSCWRKRRKRTVEQERAYQEQARKVALENGKRLGESPSSLAASHLPIQNKSRYEFVRGTHAQECVVWRGWSRVLEAESDLAAFGMVNKKNV